MTEGRKLYMLRFACGHFRGVISRVELDDRQLKYLGGGQCGRQQCAPLRRPRDWDKDVRVSQSKAPEQQKELQDELRKEQGKARRKAYYQANREKIRTKQREYRKAKKEARL